MAMVMDEMEEFFFFFLLFGEPPLVLYFFVQQPFCMIFKESDKFMLKELTLKKLLRFIS